MIKTMSDLRKSVMLTITEACNLNCVYCYEHNKTSKEMSKDLLFTIIESALHNSDTPVEFSFHGGEPFLKFDLMRETAEHFWKKYDPENEPEHLHWTHIIISNVKASIAGTFHGLDAIHLQRYLDEISYRFNRRWFTSGVFSRLVTACACSAKITYAELIG